MAFEGFQFAKEQGKAQAYNRRVMGAYFQEEKHIGRLDVLTQLAGEIGLNSLHFREALETGRYGQAHQDALRYATEQVGITAVPTFVIGEETLVGLQRKEAIEAAIVVATHALADRPLSA